MRLGETGRGRNGAGDLLPRSANLAFVACLPSSLGHSWKACGRLGVLGKTEKGPSRKPSLSACLGEMGTKYLVRQAGTWGTGILALADETCERRTKGASAGKSWARLERPSVPVGRHTRRRRSNDRGSEGGACKAIRRAYTCRLARVRARGFGLDAISRFARYKSSLPGSSPGWHGYCL